MQYLSVNEGKLLSVEQMVQETEGDVFGLCALDPDFKVSWLISGESAECASNQALREGEIAKATEQGDCVDEAVSFQV